MRPTPAQKLYQKVAEKHNLPEEYVKDLVEFYYMETKTRMHTLTHVVFSLHGLGKFRLRPKKFYHRQGFLNKLIEKFSDRGDIRGATIRAELLRRKEELSKIEPEVKELRLLKQKKCLR